MHLEPLLRPELTLLVPDCPGRDQALEAAAHHAAHALPALAQADLLKGLAEREQQYPTSTPEGVAFPHVLLPGVDHTTVVACLFRPGVRWAERDSALQDLVFVMVGSDSRPWEHVRVLARLARIAKAPGALDRLREARDSADLFARLVAEDRAHA